MKELDIIPYTSHLLDMDTLSPSRMLKKLSSISQNTQLLCLGLKIAIKQPISPGLF